jgi:hypothetical protein
MSSTLKSVSYANFLDLYHDQLDKNFDLRLGQLFHILFIKDDDNSIASTIFNSDGSDAIQLIAEWMECTQTHYCNMIIPDKNLSTMPKKLKKLIKFNKE